MKQKRNSSVKRRDVQKTIYRKTGKNAGKLTSKRKRKTSRCQTGGFLNRYDFAYAGRETVNQVGKIAPKVIGQATSETNKIAQQRVDQAIRSGGAEIERVEPKIIRGAIEEEKRCTRHLSDFLEIWKRNNLKKLRENCSNEKKEPVKSQQVSTKEDC